MRPIIAWAFTLLAAGAAHAAPLPWNPPGPYQVTCGKVIKYASRADTYLTACEPVSTPDWPGAKPAVLLIHGGAWSGGDASVSPNTYNGYSGSWAYMLASWGFKAYSVSYPLQRNGVQAPAALNGAQAAVRYVRAHATELGIDSRMVAAWGDSAGGSLAYQLGWMTVIAPPAPGMQELTTSNVGVNTGVQAVVAAMAPYSWGPDAPTPATIAANVLTNLPPPPPLPSGAPPPLPSTSLGRRETADTLIIQGMRDHIVQQDQGRAAYCTLRNFKRPVHWLQYDGDHEYSGVNGQAWFDMVLPIQLGVVQFLFNHGQYAPAGVTPIIPRTVRTPHAATDNGAPAC